MAVLLVAPPIWQVLALFQWDVQEQPRGPGHAAAGRNEMGVALFLPRPSVSLPRKRRGCLAHVGGQKAAAIAALGEP